jgi:L-alanine-DL-glutamate epimerase-like enolase superfamily enzyme
MKITEVVCTPFSIPFKTPMLFAGGLLTHTRQVLVEVRTDQGLTGVGEAMARPYVYGESQKGIVAAIETWFAPAMVGLDPFAVEEVWRRFAGVAFNHTAKAALDVALHDIIGQAAGLSVRQLLGGCADKLQVSYVTGVAEPLAVAEEALRFNASHGITSFKLKAGLDLAQDIATLRAVREALPDGHISLDPNERYGAPEALRLLAAARDLGAAWVEEPVAGADRHGRRRVADAGLLPILGDDTCRTPVEAAREVTEGLVSLVSIKVARTGFTLSKQIHGLCAAQAAGLVMGAQGGSGIDAAAAFSFGAAHALTSRLPGELSFGLELDGDIVEEAPAIQDGVQTYPDRAGLGVTLDRRALARMRD